MIKSLALLFAIPLTPVAFAQTDSSADTEGFLEQVEVSSGVILRVPINERGEENTAEAEMRLHTDDVTVNSLDDAETAWNRSVDLEGQNTFSEEEVTDSSTQGWYGWRSYGNYWGSPYYYRSYRPYYYSYGNYYRYSSPYYYSSYSSYPYYRYYYYPCYW